MTKYLVVNVNWLGDVIFSTPIFRALRQADAQSHIACLAVPRVREILQCVPEIDEIITYDESGSDKGIGAKLRLVRRLKKRQFDQAFFLSRSLSRAVLIRLAGVPSRVGYENKGRGRLLTQIVNAPEKQLHRSDYYLNVVEAAGIAIADRSTYLKPPSQAEEYVTMLMTKHGLGNTESKIIFNPGGNWDLKRWPKKSFARLMDYVARRRSVRMILTGGEEDRPLAAEICAMLISKIKPVDLTGALSLSQFAAFIKQVDLFISADSGPLHIASSVGTPCIGIFGPTRPEWTGPRGCSDVSILQRDVGCNRRPCYYLECPENSCMQAITVDDVFSHIQKFTA